MKLSKIKKIHFTGIKGVGMASLAICAKDFGIKVSGSDIEEIFVTDETLKRANIDWVKGFDKENVLADTDLLITTGAHGGLNNVEVAKAKRKGIKVITQGEAVALFAEGKKTISVCGVGGKTSVSSMIATILESAGKNPSYAIGVGEIFPLGPPGTLSKKGEYFVTEADEFVVSPGVDDTPKFLLLDPFITVVTNVEHDHPDVYPTFEEAKEAYLKFLKKTAEDGLLVVNADNPNSLSVAKKSGKKTVTYGFSKDSDWKIEIVEKQGFKVRFNLMNKKRTININLNVPGDYNVSNAAASIIVGLEIGIPAKDVKEGIEKFTGSKRRFEEVGKIKTGALLVDDYAHHPSEIKSVLKVAGEAFPDKRLVVLFQPHTYTRTKVFFDEFAGSFQEADVAGFVDIYSSAREKKDVSVSSKKLAEKVGGIYTGGLKETTKWILENTKKDDVVLTLGAGDIFLIHKNLI